MTLQIRATAPWDMPTASAMTRSERIGSLCSGYGGLDLAIGGTVAWHVEYDPAPAKILAARFPGVPNFHDVKTVRWAELEPVDVLTAGYPCQPFSYAGQRKGTEDARHLWPYIADAVRVLRPRRVFLENVAGHLTSGFGDVLGDLARLGYDCRWCCVRAADAGSCHARKRVFILAADADSASGQRIADSDEVQAPPRELPPGNEPDRLGELAWWRATPERAEYAPAVERWAGLTREPPHVVDTRNRLNPRFSEWMMGLPEGWVTDVEIPVTAQHRAIGNGVCPQQARLAWLILSGEQIDTHTHTGRLLPTPTGRDHKGRNQRNDTTCLPGAVLSLSLSPSDTPQQRQQRTRETRDRRTGPTDRLLPTPTAHTGRRPIGSKGDPARWLNPARNNDLPDFIAYLQDKGRDHETN